MNQVEKKTNKELIALINEMGPKVSNRLRKSTLLEIYKERAEQDAMETPVIRAMTKEERGASVARELVNGNDNTPTEKKCRSLGPDYITIVVAGVAGIIAMIAITAGVLA